MKSFTRLAVLAFAVAALALAALPAAATTYVPVSDQALLEGATAVVEARVLSVEPAPVAGRWPATDTMIEVQKVVAGEISGRNLLVRLPGGTRPDGSGVELHGIPRFGIGERLFLFLTAGDDGTFRVVHLMLGAFRERVVGGQRVLLRDLSGAVAMEMPGNPPLAQLLGPRDAEKFGRWVADAARGAEREADYFLADDEVRGVERVTADFRLFKDDRSGLSMRWFEFDVHADVDFYIANGGQPGFGESATASAARAAIGAWNGARGTNIRYRYAGTTGNSSLNVIEFNNAGNAIDSAFNCSSGGVLAVGGPSYSRFLREAPNGTRFHPILNAGVILNKNIECFLTRGANRLDQLLAHELGHTLGIHHPCGDGGKSCDVANDLEQDALMYPFIHNDARGARINEDDRAAARALYPGSDSGGGGGTKPVAPSDLAATALSATEVELSWSDNSSDETQFRVEARVGSGAWARVATTAADATGVVVGDLLPATTYSFRVLARRGTSSSAPSGEASATTLPDAPPAPGSFTGATTSATGVVLTWSDQSSDETGFQIEVRTPSSGAWVPVATLPPNTTSWTLEPLLTGVPHSFRIRALGSQAASLPSEVVSLTPQAPDAPCGGSPSVLCLQDRFRVTVAWNDPRLAGNFGAGTGAAFEGDQSGTFWFFNPANIELIVKVLDATTLNDHFWVFHGALTDVEYWISVLDTETGRAKTYYNPPFDRCGEFDTAAIPGEELPAAHAAPAAVYPNRVRAEGVDTGSCGDDDTLCLLGGRFEVEVDWADERAGTSGVGRKVTGSDQTGYFWFFDQSNIELVVKMIDARPIGGGFWVFYGSLSDVEYTLTVTDTVALEGTTYVNAQGNQCGQFDTAAFPILGAGFSAP
jgi:hypothetical protein